MTKTSLLFCELMSVWRRERLLVAHYLDPLHCTAPSTINITSNTILIPFKPHWSGANSDSGWNFALTSVGGAVEAKIHLSPRPFVQMSQGSGWMNAVPAKDRIIMFQNAAKCPWRHKEYELYVKFQILDKINGMEWMYISGENLWKLRGVNFKQISNTNNYLWALTQRRLSQAFALLKWIFYK